MQGIKLLVVPACSFLPGDNAKSASRGAGFGSGSSVFYSGLVVAVSY